MIYLFTRGGDPTSPIFAFDAELSEERTDEAEVTEFAVESNATVSDFVWIKPVVYAVNGRITASPFDGLPGLARLQRIHQALIQAKDKRQLVTLVTETWIDDCVIKSVRASRGREEGESLQIEISLQTVLRPTVETVRIDPSRLRNRRKGNRRMTAKQRTAASTALLNDLARTGRYKETLTNSQPAFGTVLP